MSSSSSNSEDRLMNDTTMPPPRKMKSNPRYAATTTTTTNRTTAVNVKERGLKKGFGLHDWKRLLQHSNDLAQRNGKPLRRDITKEEVKLHNKEYDGWMILRGRVYNIGPYLHYHPGGVSILKGILGKDGTKLFDKYHRWVNIDGLIGPLCLGMIGIPMKEESERTTTILPGPISNSKETVLPNAPRVLPVALPTSSLSINKNDGDAEEEDEDDDNNDALLLPPPPPRG